ncbi:hypothetical protein K435DRAFT_856087 [Dendrothele bispora CBS 962.96]|uniref:Uncharacterized protein n=1 Tax=Dendrothele bispora (strain CBS 962.96) TaxID=1314807 RepID=A0A4S8MAM8_DENBC|nr:hypothetical protein K435DRAFT_856087 [Dendrothele bispora CBS 962.96]
MNVGRILVLRASKQTSRPLRAHHPYKRVIHAASLSDKPPDYREHLQGADVNEFLQAVVLLPPLDEREPPRLPFQENMDENADVNEPQPELEGRQQGWIMRFRHFLIALLLILLAITAHVSRFVLFFLGVSLLLALFFSIPTNTHSLPSTRT